ncbi:MAG: cpdA 3 [Gammaproteobacteria bacterium]|jgi:Icc protein|nr:cpdA 3 [Gammaproteobacteria bacterium]
MIEKVARIVQISDMHLYANKESTLLGVNTYESFSVILNLVKSATSPPDLILLTGDLTQDHSEASYQHVVDAFKTASIPIYYVPGNHDDAKIMKRILPCAIFPTSKHIILDQWQLILLDSQKPQAVEGYLNRSELDFLETCLQQHPERHAIIVFHHQPIPVGATWLDKLGLTNAEELWAILQRYSHVHTILFGHVHQEHQGEKKGIKYFSTPSTCIQFKRNCVDFALEELPPGYRWVDLYPHGELKTAVCRAAHYVGKFDGEAKGY